MIKEIKQDIFYCEAEAIANCCNTFCVMGKGVAKEIKLRYPSVYYADQKTECGNKEKLGYFSYAWIKENEKFNAPNLKIVFNLYGQHYYGTRVKQLSYDALYDGLIRILQFCKTNNIKSLAVPYKIGCGLARGNWDVAKCILYSIFNNNKNVDLLICEKP